jgi:hypothetical protein
MQIPNRAKIPEGVRWRGRRHWVRGSAGMQIPSRAKTSRDAIDELTGDGER